MRAPKFAVVVTLASLLLPAAALAGVNVRFVAPERFADQDFRSPYKREPLMKELERFLQRVGELYLRPGQTLRIEVLDVDLAGRYEPFNTRFNDVRVMRDVTPPRVKLRYRLEAAGRTLASAEETVSDLNYLMNIQARNSGEWLPYEKAMLRDWFRRRFGEGQRPRG
ncbi:DUF3016 domain-containing protein [Phreatobacter stygius]|uniref:DUF3016 domain-containing protein n=1 Tax=Phreatobacter stygius TaxID=1940610 RepID=A0A4D7BEM7_9HYPH|nr:DUF3016 domain-containing protein [Phreatobacter stygius]QCI67726.1 DUF3016 domain-containing protein [Phreatobacter stygius]